MIKNIEIFNFRLFKDLKFNMGKKITVVAGKNGVGKSNLLGMLGNSVELKKYKPIIHKRYRTEFSDIFKGSVDYDPSGSKKFKVNFTDEHFITATDYREFRVAWQDKNSRFRIIPSGLIDGKKTEAKAKWPVLYLGLSRLFPLGEADDDNIKSEPLKLNPDEEKWFIAQYKKILSMSGEIIDSISNIDVEDSKKSIGINTPNYDYLSNSAGQDNVGQILCALLSFRRLKEDTEYDYTGGLLLIDELDATLHPLAQQNLFDIIYKFSKENSVQVVFTTHSMSLLKYITEKTYHNDEAISVNNDIELIYLSNDNFILENKRNPGYDFIKNELLLQSGIHKKDRIKVYVEDEEAKWLIEKTLSKYFNRINVKSSKLGSNELIRLNNLDIDYFSKVIICLDGDVDQAVIDKSFRTPIRFKNIIKLPGTVGPEKVFHDYLVNLPGEHEFLDRVKDYGLTIKYFIEKGPDSYSGDLTTREKYKAWFRDHMDYFDEYQLYDYWEHDNKELVSEFLSEFIIVFNELAKHFKLPIIKIN